MDDEDYQEAWEEFDVGRLYGKTLKQAQKLIEKDTDILIPLEDLENLLPESDMELSSCCKVITDREELHGLDIDIADPSNNYDVRYRKGSGCERCGKVVKNV